MQTIHLHKLSFTDVQLGILGFALLLHDSSKKLD